MTTKILELVTDLGVTFAGAALLAAVAFLVVFIFVVAFDASSIVEKVFR
jgi:hypothetical protein